MNALAVILLGCLLLAFSWPLALAILMLLPLVWLITLPLRLAGLCVSAGFGLLKALLFLPARLLGDRR